MVMGGISHFLIRPPQFKGLTLTPLAMDLSNCTLKFL